MACNRGTMSEWYADEKPSGKPFVPETGPPEYEDPLAMTEMRELGWGLRG